MTEKIVPFTIEQWQFPMRKGSEIQFSADCKHSLASFLFCLPANLNQVSLFSSSQQSLPIPMGNLFWSLTEALRGQPHEVADVDRGGDNEGRCGGY